MFTYNILKFLLNVAALHLTSSMIKGIRYKGTLPLFAMVLVITVLNIFVRPILFILTIPLTVISMGLFIFILNGIIFLMAGRLVKDYHIDDLWAGTAGWFMYSLFSCTLNFLFITPYYY